MATRSTSFDAILVGGGVACLYAALRLRKRHGRGFRIVILERTHRVGGRVYPQSFAGKTINCGAGVGRLRKDLRLKRLLLELGLPIERYTTSAMDENDKIINGALARLHSAVQPFRGVSSVRPTFHEFAVSVLGSQYAQFVRATGYSDFEQTDCVEALDNYGFDDTLGRNEFFVVPWQRLLDELMTQSGVKAMFGQTVQRVRTGKVYSISEDGTRQKFRAPLVIVGVTINCLRHIIPDRNIYSQVRSQPFIKVFARLATSDPPRAEAAKSLWDHSGPILVGKPLQKMFEVDMKTNVYNVAYADNDSARLLRRKGRTEIEQLFSSVAGFSTVFSLYYEKYWPEGTHFFPPSPFIIHKKRFLHALQRPYDGVWVVGEAVSPCHHGWVEGALESVDELATDLLI